MNNNNPLTKEDLEQAFQDSLAKAEEEFKWYDDLKWGPNLNEGHKNVSPQIQRRSL